MKSGNKKYAFTLAEVMIVVLILTILFAAFAPLITKRRIATNRSKYAVWSYKDKVTTMDAYYDPGDQNYTGTLFIGTTPDGKPAVLSTFLPVSRLTIRSGSVTSEGKLQRQIQFRYGRSGATNSDEKRFGKFAGSWLMDGKNILLGGEYNTFTDPEKIEAKYNVGIGYNSLNSLTNAQNNAALGYYALASNNSGSDNVAIGFESGKSLTSGKNNTLVGAKSGRNINGNYNTAIGYNAGAGKANSTGEKNTFIGAYAGQDLTTGSKNLAIGAGALKSITTGSYNVAVGYNALSSLTTGGYNVAIGYNACSQVTTGSKKTCIGYNSGPKANSTAEKYLKATADDKERTYIGGTPYNYGGDAVLEIHNVGGTNSKLLESPSVKSNTTTVINGNLIVRGRAFFTSGNNLMHFNSQNPGTSGVDLIYGYDKHHKLTCVSDQKTYTFAKNCVKLSTSDRRLKNIGSKSLAGLNEISKLNVYNYIYKNDAKKLPQIGVIAQDLRKVFPNSVLKDQDGYLSIKWDEMFFASINAIKELDKKIVALVKRTTVVESQIAQLENENASLKSQVDNLSIRIEKLKTK